jgi:hypothetical protein
VNGSRGRFDRARSREDIAVKKVPDNEIYTPSLAADLDVFRKVLMRRLADREEGWRRCQKPVCRRQRACLGDPPICVRAEQPAPELSPEQEAAARHDFHVMVKNRLAELDAQAAQQREQTKDERHSAQHRPKAGKSGRPAHRKKTGGAP